MKTQQTIADHAQFDRIRYAHCWEDADVLLEAARVGPGDTCLSIASAGDNVLSLVGEGAARVIAVDLNPAQIACLELRVAAIRRLSHSEFLVLLGHHPGDRRALYRRCRADLAAATRQFWDDRPDLVMRGIAQGGRFETYLQAFRRFVLPLIHDRATINRLFELEDESARREFYDRHFNNRRFALACRLFFDRRSLGRFGRDPSFSRFADEPVWRSLQRRIPQAMVVQRPADNPYLQWILKGRFDTALPHAWRAASFARIRDNLDSLEWHLQPIEDLLASLPDDSLDACNLSDIFEYMPRADYERLLGEFVRTGAPGCRLVYWNVVTERRSPRRHRDVLRPLRELGAQLHGRDKAFFYRDLVVEEVL